MTGLLQQSGHILLDLMVRETTEDYKETRSHSHADVSEEKSHSLIFISPLNTMSIILVYN